MHLPPHIKLEQASEVGANGKRVVMHGITIGEYAGLSWPTNVGWRYRNARGAHGKSATEWGCVVALVELARVDKRLQQREVLESMSFEMWLTEYRRRHINSSIPNIEVLQAIYEDRLVAFDEDTFGEA